MPLLKQMAMKMTLDRAGPPVLAYSQGELPAILLYV